MSTIRSRTVGSYLPGIYHIQGATLGGGTLPPPPAHESGPGDYRSLVRAMTDTVTPGFRKLRSRGVFINSPLNIEVTAPAIPDISFVTRQAMGTQVSPGVWQYAQYTCSGDLMKRAFGHLVDLNWAAATSSGSTVPFSINSLANLARIEALSRVEPAKSQSLVTLAEMHKSVATLVDRVEKLASVVTAARHHDGKLMEKLLPGKRTRGLPRRVVLWDHDGSPIIRKNGKPDRRYSHPPLGPRPSQMDAASQLWLEYRYGWSPIVYDIVDTLAAMYAADLRAELIFFPVKRATAHKTGQGVVSSSQTVDFFGSLTAITERRHKVSCGAYILYKWLSEGGMLQRMNDFGVFDVPRAIWELVPYSFVADWILPVGDWLGALTPKFGVEVLASGDTLRRELQVIRTVTAWNGGTGNLAWTGSIPVGSSEMVSYDSKIRQVPLGTPTYPPVTLKISVPRLVDALSLIRGARKSNLRV